MRIAICFSGQIRSALENFDNIKEFFGECFKYSDIFIHTSNINCYKSINCKNIFIKPKIINKSTIEKIKELYNPKHMIVDDYDGVGYKICELYGIQPLWYSYWKCNELKKIYEKNNNFEYDYVVKIRFDFVANYEQNSFEMELQNVKSDNFLNWNSASSVSNSDVFFLSNSKNSNIISEYFFNIIKYYEKCKLEIVDIDNEYFDIFSSYIQRCKIKQETTIHITKIAILRDIFISYLCDIDKSEWYELCGKLEDYFFKSYDTIIDDNCLYKDIINDLKEKNIELKNNNIYYIDDILPNHLDYYVSKNFK